MANFDSEDVESRTFKACAVFDNGNDDSAEVKRNSASLTRNTCGELFAGCGCDEEDRFCFGGDNQGISCNGDDSACGSGICDARPLLGGTTTDDEMFVPFGFYYTENPE